MCEFKSGLLFKDRVYIGDTDSHNEMLKVLNIEDTRKNAETLFVRAELIPIDGDAFSDINTWKFKVDQDILPEWFVLEHEKTRMVEAVKEWAKDHIFVGVDNLELTSGSGYYIKDCKNVKIGGTAKVNIICGCSTIEYVGGTAKIEYVGGNATIKYVCDDVKIERIGGSATIECAYGGVTIKDVGGTATIEYVGSNVAIKLVRGNATIKFVCDDVKIKRICDDVTIEYVGGNATIEYVGGTAKIEYVGGTVTIASSDQTNWVNKDAMKITENATFKDNYTKTIHQAGDWKFVAVGKEE